jgi:RNA polymerase sigma factor (sigma-70 family)
MPAVRAARYGRRFSRTDPCPRLTPERERELVLAAQAGDPDARDELIVAFQPLIASVARMYRQFAAVDHAELMQEGAVGLFRALRRYDPEARTPFWGYASWWVRQAMQQLVSELTRAVILSDRALRALARVKGARRDYLQAHGREPTCGELAAGTGLARSQVDDLILAERRPRGLEEPLNGDDGAGTFGDLVADPVAEEAYERVPHRLAVEQLPDLLGSLSERERTVLDGRFGLGGPERTLREIAGTLGVSAERVRQLEQRALGRLRDALDPEDDDAGSAEARARDAAAAAR